MKNPFSKEVFVIFFLTLGALSGHPVAGFPAESTQGIPEDAAAGAITKLEGESRPVSGPNPYSKMIHDATEAIRQNPGEPTLYLARSWAFHELNKTDEQIADATMAIKLKTKNGKAFFLRADGYLRQGRYQVALRDLTRAINLGDADEETYQYRALVMYYLGRFKEAVNFNTKILASNPGAVIPRLDRGLANFCMGRDSAAFSDIESVLGASFDPAVSRQFEYLRKQILDSPEPDHPSGKALLEMIKKLRDSKKPAPGIHYGKCRRLAI